MERGTPVAALKTVAALAAYLALAVFFFAGTWFAADPRWIGVGADPVSTTWSIQWVAYATLHGQNPFITNYIFYPYGLNILWANADAPVALGWAILPVTQLFGPLVSYNMLQTLALGLSAWAAFIAIRAMAGNTGAAFAGGLVYGFGPYMQGQAYGHLGLSFAVVPPLLLWLLYRMVVRGDMSPIAAGAIAGALEAFQLLVAAELVLTEAMLVLGAMTWLVVVAVVLRLQVQWRAAISRVLVSGVAAIVVFLVLAGYPVYTLLRGPTRITHGPIRGFGVYVTDLQSLAIPMQQTQLLHNDWTVRLSSVFVGGAPEAGGYIGVALLALLLFSLIRWRREPIVLFAAGAFIFTVLMSLGPTLTVGGAQFHAIHLPWRVFKDIPFANEVLPDRLSLYFDLFAAVVLAFFIDRTWKSSWRPAGLVATAASLALLVPSWPWSSSVVHVPTLFQPGTSANQTFASSVSDGAVVVLLPATNVPRALGYSMLWQAYDRDAFRMPEGDLLHGDADGRGTNDPPPSPLWTAMHDLDLGLPPPSSEADLALVRAQLTDLHVRAVVVGQWPAEAMAVDYFTLLLGQPPTEIGGVHFWPLAT